MAKLSCTCDDYGDFDYYFEYPEWFSTMPERKRRTRCHSCRTLLNPGDTVAEFLRYRFSDNEVDERIYGSEVPLASVYYCERCGEIFFNLEATGMCVIIGGNIRDALEQYWDMTGFDPARYAADTRTAQPAICRSGI